MIKDGHPNTEAIAAKDNSWKPDSPPHTKNPNSQKIHKLQRRIKSYTLATLLAITTATGTIKPATPEQSYASVIEPNHKIELVLKPAKEQPPPVAQLRRLKTGMPQQPDQPYYYHSLQYTNPDTPPPTPELNRRPFPTAHYARDNSYQPAPPAIEVTTTSYTAPLPETPAIETPATPEIAIQHGTYALEAPTQIHDDIIYAAVAEYRNHDNASFQIAQSIIQNKNEYQLNAETVMVPFMIQEGSFGKVVGNLSGDHNIGNLRDPRTGQFADYDSWESGVRAIFHQIHRYLRVWPTEKGITHINDLESALYIYAPPHENPTDFRLQVAKALIDELRALSERYERGEISKEQLDEEIHKIRVRLQKTYGPSWV